MRKSEQIMVVNYSDRVTTLSLYGHGCLSPLPYLHYSYWCKSVGTMRDKSFKLSSIVLYFQEYKLMALFLLPRRNTFNRVMQFWTYSLFLVWLSL